MNKNQILIRLSESEESDFGRVEFEDQSDPQKVFSAIWALESEVNNGGFLQYFENSSGETATHAPTALRTIGALACAAIVERALKAVSAAPLPVAQAPREALLRDLPEAMKDQLDALDQEFYAYPDDLTDLLFAYVAAHQENFGPIEGPSE